MNRNEITLKGKISGYPKQIFDTEGEIYLLVYIRILQLRQWKKDGDYILVIIPSCIAEAGKWEKNDFVEIKGKIQEDQIDREKLWFVLAKEIVRNDKPPFYYNWGCITGYLEETPFLVKKKGEVRMKVRPDGENQWIKVRVKQEYVHTLMKKLEKGQKLWLEVRIEQDGTGKYILRAYQVGIFKN